MDKKDLIYEYTKSLRGKTLLLTGAGGGLGKAVFKYLAVPGGKYILISRSEEKSKMLKREYDRLYPGIDIEYLSADFENCKEVKALCEKLQKYDIDYLMHNAGNYFMPRRKSAVGVDGVFQINFLSPYYMTKELLPILKKTGGKVIITGSIAHSMSEAKRDDVDFSRRSLPEAVYGNSKRYLMYAHKELLRESGIKMAIAHPGISPTGITDNYANLLQYISKPGMRLVFMAPEKACLGLLRAVFEDLPFSAWAGPKRLNIWGKPAIKALPPCSFEERKFIFESAEKLYSQMKNL